MAESYSVKALLSAHDKGFTATLKQALGMTDKLGNSVKSGLGFGILTGIGQAAFGAISSGVRDLVGEIDSSNKAWKTFEGNMKILGKTEDEINCIDVKNEWWITNPNYKEEVKMSKYGEVRNDYYDEKENKVYIDAWFTYDDNEEGIVVAKVNYKTNLFIVTAKI